MVDLKEKQKQQHQQDVLELIEFNANNRKRGVPVILLAPNHIYQVRKVKGDDCFKFLVLSKHFNEKVKKVLPFAPFFPIQVGFNISKGSIKYYLVTDVEWEVGSKYCFITLKCHSDDDKQMLESRFRGH